MRTGAIAALALPLGACASGGDFGDFSVQYEQPTDPTNAEWADAFAELGLFEAAVEGVNDSFALPRNATVLVGECGLANAFWSPDNDAIVMCTELAQDVLVAFANSGWELDAETAVQGTINTMLWVFYHEMGHALVDLLDLPITGREEDAVDDFSTVLFVEAGGAEAALDAGLYFMLMDTGSHPTSAMADEHSLGLQRFYNVLCMVYGSDPAEFGYLIDIFPDMTARAPRCESEYEQKLDSWTRLLEPHEL